MRSVLLMLIFFVTTHLYASEIMNNVVIISIDALHPDAVTQENAPNIMEIADKGVLRLNGRSTKPPKTLVSHSAMFTGLTPETGGRADNSWKEGESTVASPTIFNTAKQLGYNTIFVYNKEKLGYLVNEAVDYAVFEKEYPIDKTLEKIKAGDGNFIFLHISGLDITGPEYGWMSPEYIEDFSFIDEELKPLLDTVEQKDRYLLVITSDHAGHDKLHGCDHPDDYKLPFISASDVVKTSSPVIERFETYMLTAYLRSIGLF